MSPILMLLAVGAYFVLLVIISFFTGRKANEDTYFKGNRSSPWYLVAFGMIGASLSGVTFISVPGWVSSQGFSYMQMVLGYLIGYAVIAFVLMPLYYRLNLTSIYGYLETRFGKTAYKTGAFFFLLSRTIGAAFRLYLVAIVLQLLVSRIPVVAGFLEGNPAGDSLLFGLTVVVSIGLIYLYTFRGGIKTVVWTDTLQTLFMLVSAGLAVWWIAGEMDLTAGGLVKAVSESEYSKIWVWDFKAGNFAVKHILAGAFTAIVMTGLDQDMMQKNLTCKSIGEAQTNMVSFSVVLVFVNLGFLTLGALLYMYGAKTGLVGMDEAGKMLEYTNPSGLVETHPTDKLFPLLAFDYFPAGIGVLFLLGLVAAAYSSADSALASLTTSFCVDFLDFEKRDDTDQKKKTRFLVQAGFSVVLILVILLFKFISDISDKPVVANIFKAAGYTYGPLLGMYAFGLFTKLQVRDKMVLVVAIAAPIVSYVLNLLAPLIGYNIGFEILLYNGILTFLGLLIISNGRLDPETIAKLSGKFPGKHDNRKKIVRRPKG